MVISRMTLDKVTSLADLEFKAKTNKYYRQLDKMAAEQLFGSRYSETYEKAMRYLHNDAFYKDGCASIVTDINYLRKNIEPDEDGHDEDPCDCDDTDDIYRLQ